MENYSRKLASDRAQNTLQEFAVPFPALQTTTRENASASSVTSFNANTTTIEVAAIGATAGIRWAGNQATSVIVAAGTANADNFIPAGTLRRFVIPRSVMAIANFNAVGNPSVVGLNTAEGLYTGLATITGAVGSVLVTQY